MRSTRGDHASSVSAMSDPITGASAEMPSNLRACTALRAGPPYVKTDRKAVNAGGC
jgi:hypothetical protein